MAYKKSSGAFFKTRGKKQKQYIKTKLHMQSKYHEHRTIRIQRVIEVKVLTTSERPDFTADLL